MTDELKLHADTLIDFVMWRQTLRHYKRMWEMGHMTADQFAKRLQTLGFTDYEAKAVLENQATLIDPSRAIEIEAERQRLENTLAHGPTPEYMAQARTVKENHEQNNPFL